MAHFKPTTIELYGSRGYLDYGNKYTAVDRVSAANRLFIDYYLAGMMDCTGINYSKIRVDGGGSLAQQDLRLIHEDNYRNAVRAIPHEFWTVVRHVVIDDLPLDVEGTERQKNQQGYHLKVLLCMGLDRLIDHYRSK